MTPALISSRLVNAGLTLTLVAVAGMSQAGDEAWLQPVEEGYARLDAKLKNFKVRGRLFNKEDPPGKPPGERKLAYSFEYARFDECVKTTRQEDPASDRNTYMAANDNYFFSVMENAPGALPSLLELGERRDFSFGNVRRRGTLRWLLADATGLLGNFGFPLESPLAVLKHNAPGLRSQETTLAGRKVLLLEGDIARFTDKTGLSDHEIKNYTARNSRVFLDPALDYRLVRWDSKLVNQGQTYVYSETYEYDHALDGYPLLSSYKRQVGYPEVMYSTMEVEFSDWQFNVNRPAEFRLSHYGLKEPDYGSKPWLSGWMWLLLIGGVLLTVGVWLYRRMPSKPA
jgi:hypothetical protein